MKNLRKILLSFLGPAIPLAIVTLPPDGVPDGRWWFLVVLTGLGGVAGLGANAGIKKAQQAQDDV